MKPEEKAKELIDKFSIGVRAKVVIKSPVHYAAKQCALICVDEIVESESLDNYFDKTQINQMEHTSDSNWISEVFMSYWEEVKQEIEKL